MAGLNLDGGMGTLGTAAFGGGLMRGLDKARQHSREDEQDEMRQEQHGLQMRQGEQSYSQREELFPEQLQAAKNVNESSGLRIKGERRQEQVDQLDHDALFNLYTASQDAAEQMRQGNPNAVNEVNAHILEKYGTPTTIWMPTKDGKIGRFDPNNIDEPLDVYGNFSEASEAYWNNARDLYKRTSPTAYKKMLEAEPKQTKQNWRGLGNSGYAIDAESGRTQKVYDPEPRGAGGRGGSGGGINSTDEATMNRWTEGYYGKRDAMGQFVLTEQQKYQAVEAQERAIAMLNADPSLSMSQAYQIAVGSVSGKIPLSKAEELAALEAEEQGIQETIKGGLGNKPNPEYSEFIKSRAQEIVSTGQKEADYLYRQIAGMPQQQPAQPQENEVPQATSNQPIQINSKEEFDRLPIGTQFIAPDGSVRIK